MKRLLTGLLLVLQAALCMAQQRYASHSVLAEGRWAKVSVETTGIYELTDELCREAGFSDPARVKVYGYGGARQPEVLTGTYLADTDDLHEVPVCVVDGRRFFFATGPVTWATAQAPYRELNNYARRGYYFLTENDAQQATLTAEAFENDNAKNPWFFHSLYEEDNYYWYHGGRNLFDREQLPEGTDRNYYLAATDATDRGTLTVAMTYNNYCDAEVLVNGQTVGYVDVTEANTKGDKKHPFLDNNNPYYDAMLDYWTFNLPYGLLTDTTCVTLRKRSGGVMRLDYLSLRTEKARPWPAIGTADMPVPTFEGAVANQDLHADAAIDMVIIVPTSRNTLSGAERLKALHEEHDGLRVKIVSADQLYNEFSSGTPDANAYRRYLKMLYDRAKSPADKPAYLLLFGDGAWDNRMVLPDWSSTSPDDFLLSFESENSFSETQSYALDDYFCFLDDGEGGSHVTGDKADVAVGRLPARTAQDAFTMAQKTIAYRLNEQAGDWQNIVCFMADDGNDNLHMQDAEYVIDSIGINNTAFRLKKIYWDGYTALATSAGKSLPEVKSEVASQMKQGALIMNYTGHGSALQLSHELSIELEDFKKPGLGRLPLWFMAACDVIPYNVVGTNLGEAALQNPTGGAVAVISTVHTVYAQLNRVMNKCLMRRLIGTGSSGLSYPIGEALRQAKQAVFYERKASESRPSNERPNHLQYMLLGDPALRLNLPSLTATIDRINGADVAQDGVQYLEAGSEVVVEGHIDGADDFSGVATLTVMDAEETVTGRANSSDTKAPFRWTDRQHLLFNGSDSVRNGQFSIKFLVPKGIAYSEKTGRFYVWAASSNHTTIAHGINDDFIMGDAALPWAEGEGPHIDCYLNTPMFRSGDHTDSTPWFYAELSSEHGINATGNDIGHDLELVIDGRMRTSYILNDYFEYALGDYRRGSVSFQLPQLEDGEHTLFFRAWDVRDCSSSVMLSFVVGQSAEQGEMGVSQISEAKTATDADRRMVFDFSGRQVGRQGHGQSGLYIYRDSQGKVKKMMVGRQ